VPELDPVTGELLWLVNTPGYSVFSNIGAVPGNVRALSVMKNKLYAVCGSGLYRIDSTGATTTLGTLDSIYSDIWMCNSGSELFITDGACGYIYSEEDSLTQITDPDFPSAVAAIFIDGYFIAVQSGTGKFYISNLYDGTSWDALDFTTAEGNPDNAIALLDDHREIWVFGENSIEPFYNSGDVDFVFERISGGYIEKGCGAAMSPAKADNSVIWLGDDKLVYRAAGYTPQVISSPGLNYEIGGYSTISDARGFAYTIEGHTFYVLTFPTEKKTWAYDFSTRLWHRRTGFPDMGRDRSNCHAKCYGKNLVGDYELGIIYEVDFSNYSDDGNDIPKRWTSSTIGDGKTMIYFSELQALFETGVGLTPEYATWDTGDTYNTGDAVTHGGNFYESATDSNQGNEPPDDANWTLLTDLSDLNVAEDPQAVLEYSDDDGQTWSNERWASIGKIGEYCKRVVWRMLGRARNRIFRITVTDSVKTILKGADINLRAGRSSPKNG